MSNLMSSITRRRHVPTSIPESQQMDAKQFASALDINRATVYHRIERGDIVHGRKIGRKQVWRASYVKMIAGRRAA